jgi:SH3-like domain-containing protein
MGGSEGRFRGGDVGVAISTKTGLAGQASGNRLGSLAPRLAFCAAMLALAGCGPRGNAAADCPAPAQASTISGFCVPRYVSLKRDTVFARKGPGTDYPVLWIYRARGLPVQIVAETLDWRRVCDPDGGAVWVHRSMGDGRRAVQARGPAPVDLLAAPRAGAKVEGLLRPRALADFDRCEGAWCRLRAGGVSGWASADQVWGVAPAPQCR